LPEPESTPSSSKDIQVFLGFTNFYRDLIQDYAKIALLRKNVPFSWSKIEEDAFSAIKFAFTTSKFIAHPQEQKPFILETDSSDYAIGAVLSQFSDDNRLLPIAFYYRQLNPAE
jgi:hypothetical protein